MLNFNSIAPKLVKMTDYLLSVEANNDRGLNLAENLFPKADRHRAKLTELLQTYSQQLFFSAARPIDPIDTAIPIPQISAPGSGDLGDRYTVFASDSSQIAPDHHEIAYCYLVNLGRAMFHYHQSLHPLLDSNPLVFDRSFAENLIKSWKMPIEDVMVHYRQIQASQVLAKMALRWVLPPGSHEDIPNLAMLSGALIPWFQNNVSLAVKQKILSPIIAARSQLRENNIPLIGYVTATASREILNFLGLAACAYDYPDCEKNCGHLNLELEQPPCQISPTLKDRLFWAKLLAPGMRSGIWKSNSDVNALFDPSEQIYFCYANVGFEIVRLEFPAWLAFEPQLLARSTAITLNQVQKGFGYPIALSEAHHQASIRQDDRSYFYSLLHREMIRSGLSNVGTSYKAARKRVGVA